MNDLDFFKLGRMENCSPAMSDTRRRILASTRRMIEASGYDDFSIRELARQAAVSSRTIYNAFGSKDHLIAIAIRGYFEDFQARVSLKGDPATYEGALERQVAVSMRNLAIPNYLAAVSSIYFSTSVPTNVRQVLVDIGEFQWASWLRTLRARRQIEPYTRIDHLLVSLSDLQFHQVHNWRLGMIGNDRFVARTLEVVLSMLAGTTRGEARDKIRSTLRDLYTESSEWIGMINRIERQLTVFPKSDKQVFAD